MGSRTSVVSNSQSTAIMVHSRFTGVLVAVATSQTMSKSTCKKDTYFKCQGFYDAENGGVEVKDAETCVEICQGRVYPGTVPMEDPVAIFGYYTPDDIMDGPCNCISGTIQNCEFNDDQGEDAGAYDGWNLTVCIDDDWLGQGAGSPCNKNSRWWVGASVEEIRKGITDSPEKCYSLCGTDTVSNW